MKYYSILILILLFNCKNVEQKEVTPSIKDNQEITEKHSKINEESLENQSIKEGFLLVDIWKIFYGQDFALLDENKDTLISFKNEKAFIGGKSFKIMDEDGLYKGMINIESFNPENGLFILECLGYSNGVYKVRVNDSIGYINGEKNRGVLKFKTAEEYVLDSYPVPTQDNPLRMEPKDEANIVEKYSNFTYLSVKIDGDWLQVKDDKECFIDMPSEKNIVGWIRWRKNGKIILKLAHSC